MQSGATMNRNILFAGLMLAAVPAQGATCSVTSLPTLNFGSYNPFSVTNLDITTTATITCTSTRRSGEGVTTTTSLTRGGAPSFSPRQMRSGVTNTLNYNLYTTTARTTIFGDGSAGTATHSASGTASRTVPLVINDNIFGRIFAGQDPNVGTYSDTLIYTVTF
jgi:spore coat protein U-like protein